MPILAIKIGFLCHYSEFACKRKKGLRSSENSVIEFRNWLGYGRNFADFHLTLCFPYFSIFSRPPYFFFQRPCLCNSQLASHPKSQCRRCISAARFSLRGFLCSSRFDSHRLVSCVSLSVCFLCCVVNRLCM